MLDWALDAVEDGGYRWVRQRFSWAAATPSPVDTMGGPFDETVLDWGTLDAIVEAAAARGIGLIAVLDDAPEWAGSPPYPGAFADWAGAVAHRYGDAITYYQIWHNPNLADDWGRAANAFMYTDLLAQAATAIREADPQARIVLGSLAPTAEEGDRNYADDLFLEMLYAAGAGPYFDVVAAQPYGFETGPDDRRVGRDVLNFSRPLLLRDVMVAHGDADKAIWASHFGWNSMQRCWPGETSIWGHVGEIPQGEYAVGALARAGREWPWMGVMCLNGLQPRPREGGAVACTVRANPESEASAILEAAPDDTLGLDPPRGPDAEEHWGFALLTPEGNPRPAYGAVQSWAAQPSVAQAGAYRADTDLASFEGAWTLGPQGADIGENGASKVSFAFEGTGVALTVRRGPYRAFLYVVVDGAPAPALPVDRDGRAYIVLYDSLAATATVPLAQGLKPGRHVVEIEADRGWGQWALADWRVVNAPPPGLRPWSYVLFGLFGSVGIGLVAATWQYPETRSLWRIPGRLWEGLSSVARTVVSLLSAALALFASWQLLMGEAAFRRLGEHGDVVALALATGLFYFSPWAIVTLVAGALLSLIVILRPARGLAFVALTCPLYAYPLSLVGRSFALAELVLLPTLLGWALRWAGRATREKQRLWDALPAAGRALLWPLIALVAISLASSVGAEHFREALRELRLVVVEPTLYFIALVSLPMDRRDRHRVVDALVGAAVMVSVVGLVMYVSGTVITAEGGMRRLLSVYGSPNNVGLFLGRVLPLLIAAVLWGGATTAGARAWLGDLLGDRRRTLYLAAIAPVALALGLSLSRGAIVFGIPAALVAMGWLAGKRWRRATVVILLLGAAALVLLLQTPRFAGMLDLSGGTTGFRLSLWHSSRQLVRDHPLLGVGLDNFLYAYRTRYVLPTAWEEFNLSHPHNVVYDYAVRLGLLGLAGFVWTQVVFWRRLLPLQRRATGLRRALLLGLAGSMADFLAHGLVDASYFIIDLAFVYMLSLALLVWLEDEGTDTTLAGRLA